MTIRARVWAALRSPAAIASGLAVAITLYGGLLRLDAFVGKYGTLDHPAWARVATRNVAPLVPAIRPSRVTWYRVPNPYVGGDPITYIEYGRQMTSFYQPHVREPVFLAMTSVGLWALDDQDYGVSLASAVGSTLAIFATYLVGAAVLSPLAGLLAALLTAIELEIVTWGVDGRARAVGIAAVALVVIVAPYLISCAIATGDPSDRHRLSHRRLPVATENRPIDQPMSAAEYLRGKFADRPIRALDTALSGLLIQPFIAKWHGFEE